MRCLGGNHNYPWLETRRKGERDVIASQIGRSAQKGKSTAELAKAGNSTPKRQDMNVMQPLTIGPRHQFTLREVESRTKL